MRTLSQKRAAAGRLGGTETFKRHGRNHMQHIGAKGGMVTHTRYTLLPVEQDNFAMVAKETGEIKAFLNGVPYWFRKEG